MRVEIYEVRVGFYEVRVEFYEVRVGSSPNDPRRHWRRRLDRRRLDRRRWLSSKVRVPGAGTSSQVLTLATWRRSPWTSVAGTGPVLPTQPITTAAQGAGRRYRLDP